MNKWQTYTSSHVLRRRRRWHATTLFVCGVAVVAEDVVPVVGVAGLVAEDVVPVGGAGLAAEDVVPVGVVGLAAGVVQVGVVGGGVVAGATPVTAVTITATGPGGRTPTPPSHIITLPQCTTAPHAIAAWIAWTRYNKNAQKLLSTLIA